MNGSIIYEVDRPENTGLSKPLKVLCSSESTFTAHLSSLLVVIDSAISYWNAYLDISVSLL
jgi:hypothetical protein